MWRIAFTLLFVLVDAKLMFVADNFDGNHQGMYSLVLGDLSQSPPAILKEQDFPGTSELPGYAGGCVDEKSKKAFFTHAGNDNGVVKVQISTVDLATFKVTHTSPTAILPGLIGAVECDDTAAEMIFSLVAASHPDSVLVTSVGINSGVVKVRANITTTQKASFDFGGSTFDEDQNIILWNWGFNMAPPYYGELVGARLEPTKKSVVYQWPYRYYKNGDFEAPAFGKQKTSGYHHIWGTNITFHSTSTNRSTVAPTDIPRSVLGKTVNPNRCQPDGIRVIPNSCSWFNTKRDVGLTFKRTLSKVDLMDGGKSTYTDVGGEQDLNGATIWAVPAQMMPDGSAYTSLDTSSSSAATFLTVWDLTTGARTPGKSIVYHTNGYVWGGPLSFYGLFDM